ncbi:PEP-CTERM sorting domain-containing protein [Neptunomonas antarctica]|uniref:PEP-CTERM protein-sorting domain-containing protein n=1 Tax=Neptunomonas antarctica TaxID=619304 RepID=A0A1N7LSL2_9GAMM|nr:PEP-CTERM sorting domain-containing protein [Neptunomonas antarctica]SIS76826.1 PEP-CTERM protein-sorting domain-containing protein [Neptunomonas antarctica]
MNIKWHIIPLSAAAMLTTGLLYNTSAQAAYIVSNGQCSTDSVTLDTVTKSDGTGTVHSGSGINATSCAGMFLGANDDSHDASSPTPNIGQLGNGFLNGQTVKSGNGGATGELDPMTFIETSDLQALDSDGIFNDPGWIHLASFQDGGNDSSSPSYSSIGSGANSLNLNDVLDITFNCDTGADCKAGTWSIATTTDIISKVQSILGVGSFDHFALVLKGGNSGVGIYDFDFSELADPSAYAFSGPDVIDFMTPYTFMGTWNTDDLLATNGQHQAQRFSHANFWARDPAAPTNEVPEPATIALFGLGLLGLAGIRKRKAV